VEDDGVEPMGSEGLFVAGSELSHVLPVKGGEEGEVHR
jgi:hypothetical protein